ncbi:cell division protein ZapE [Amycolatopsis alba DSM 44262]|uniref:Cell division protein ZapE n=1 Tax=Amycolatopsis alba DSM 44262 TaxID=1125972 RepID=A0A229RV12_AMYAL|nr:cell division protein ZapE [Amycolatopsis alba DSM 44262]
MDPGQAAVAARLDEVTRRRRGVYLWGPVGRGKTMLLDSFHSAAPVRKSRWHLHHLLAHLQSAAHELGGIDRAVAEVLDRRALLCVDEFHLHDIGDAKLLERLLNAVFARKIMLVATSNYPPEGLLPDPLFHDKIEAVVTALRARVDVVRLDGEIDYRRPGSRPGRFVVGGPVETAAGVTFGFDRLCATTELSTRDYLELAARHRRWTITGVPPLRTAGADATMRFRVLIDILVDAGVDLTVCARAPVGELFRDPPEVPDLDRIRSRLTALSEGKVHCGAK